jgi:hypothetical protein
MKLVPTVLISILCGVLLVGMVGVQPKADSHDDDDGAYGSAGLIIPYGRRVDFYQGNNLISAYMYDDTEVNRAFFINSGGKPTIFGGLSLYAAFVVDPSQEPAMGKTPLLVLVNNGSLTLKQVEVGPADSAGPGYRSLRVSN